MLDRVDRTEPVAFVDRPDLAKYGGMNPAFVRRAQINNAARQILTDFPAWAARVVIETCERHGFTVQMVIRDDRSRDVCDCRDEIQYLLKAHDEAPSFVQIGKWMNRHRVSVMWSVSRHAALTGKPPLTSTDYWGKKRQKLDYLHRKQEVPS